MGHAAPVRLKLFQFFLNDRSDLLARVFWLRAVNHVQNHLSITCIGSSSSLRSTFFTNLIRKSENRCDFLTFKFGYSRLTNILKSSLVFVFFSFGLKVGRRSAIGCQWRIQGEGMTCPQTKFLDPLLRIATKYLKAFCWKNLVTQSWLRLSPAADVCLLGDERFRQSFFNSRRSLLT